MNKSLNAIKALSNILPEAKKKYVLFKTLNYKSNNKMKNVNFNAVYFYTKLLIIK